MLDYWAVGISGRRTSGPSDYQAVGILCCNAHAMRLIYKNTGVDEKPRFRLEVRRKSDLPLHIANILAKSMLFILIQLLATGVIM